VGSFFICDAFINKMSIFEHLFIYKVLFAPFVDLCQISSAKHSFFSFFFLKHLARMFFCYTFALAFKKCRPAVSF